MCDIGKDDNRFLTFPILPRIIAIDMRNDYQIQPSNGIPDEKLCRLARQGDGPAMENLIRRYTRLVKTCARPYFLAGADAEDLMQEGMLGLLNAVREYDEEQGRTLWSVCAVVHHAEDLFRSEGGSVAQARPAQSVHVNRSTSV